MKSKVRFLVDLVYHFYFVLLTIKTDTKFYFRKMYCVCKKTLYRHTHGDHLISRKTKGRVKV